MGTRSSTPTVLVVDDDVVQRELVGACLAPLGCRVVEAQNGLEGVERARTLRPDAVVLDVRMPFLDGWEVCRRLKALPRGRLCPVLIVSGLNATAERVRGLEAGADDVLGKPFAIEELAERVRSLLSLRSYYETLDANDSFLMSLARALDWKSPFTRDHSSRVARLARNLGERCGLSASATAELFRAATVHDIGKIGVPDAILDKPGPLTAEETAILRAHVTIGAEMVAPLAIATSLLPVVRHHHERWDGAGYPDRLVGREIPLGARIVAVCDAFDAMTSDRPYRRAPGRERAIAELSAGAGRQWDADIVHAFLAMLEQAPEIVSATADRRLSAS